MKTVEFLSHLNGLGIKIWVENDKLRYRSPQGIMTTELFNPKSEPRILSTIKQQLWEAIGK
ncbi:hypothetical protein L2E81_24525 [Planktothrix agardhii 1033]|nr:hypothetical protein [Planktothrix agardhii 1033]